MEIYKQLYSIVKQFVMKFSDNFRCPGKINFSIEQKKS